MIAKTKTIFKKLLIKSKLHKLTNIIADSLEKYIYVGKFVEWCNENINIPYNDFKTLKSINYNNRYRLYDFLINKEKLSGEILYLEFGVWEGESFKYWIENNKNRNSQFIGFDTFTGLPENWGKKYIGAFSTNGSTPDINDKRSQFKVGLFQDTLNDVIEHLDFKKRLVLHMDADLYTSTLYVLTRLAPFLKPSDIIIFDDFSAKLGFAHEFRAFLDFFSSYKYSYEVIAAANLFWHVAIKITDE